MSELRADPMTGRWVIVAKNRSQRPIEFQSVPDVRGDVYCPFCEGHEAETPGETLARRSPDSAVNSPNWQIRVVPNKFPALQQKDPIEGHRDGIYEWTSGTGAHEVIIESPRHLMSTSELTDLEVTQLFDVYRERMLELRRDKSLIHCLIFKNVGSAAGATLSHSHSQLIATPIIPHNVLEEISKGQAYFAESGQCLFCHLIQKETSAQLRVVDQTDHFLAVCPFASRFPFEIWILPKQHSSHFEDQHAGSDAELGPFVRTTIRRLEKKLERCAYNYLIHSGPFDTGPMEHYHWHIEIFPRLTNAAGFEWGTGYFINPVPPEEAANLLQTVTL